MQEYLRLNSEGVVVEYPVLEHHIRNRGLRLDMFEPVQESPQPDINSSINYLSKQTPYKGDDGQWYQSWHILPLSETALRTALKELAAKLRWEIETSGTELENGTQIATERDDQTNVTKAYSTLSSGLKTVVDFKSASGWVSVDLTALTPIAEVVADHVQSAYSAERAVGEAMDLLNVEELRALNVGQEIRDQFDAFFAAARAART